MLPSEPDDEMQKLRETVAELQGTMEETRKFLFEPIDVGSDKTRVGEWESLRLLKDKIRFTFVVGRFVVLAVGVAVVGWASFREGLIDVLNLELPPDDPQ
jgi:hypothetical protein